MGDVEQFNLGFSLRIASWATVAALLIAACEFAVDGDSGTAPPETRDSQDETGLREPPVPPISPEGSHATTTPTGPTVAAPLESLGRVVVPSFYVSTLATPIDLQTGLAMLDPGDADVFNWRPDIPDDLPATAYRSTIFGRGEYADPPRWPAELIVAAQWPRAVRANVLCLVDAAQVRCSDHAAVWRVEFDGPAMALLELPETEHRRDIIFVEERDGRPEGVVPVSRTRPIDGWEVPLPATGDPPPVITNPHGGCDWVLFMQSLQPRETFTPIRTRNPSSPVYMVISVCDGHPSSYEMVPLIVVDETTVAQVDAIQPFIARPGVTYAWRLPEELLNAATTIRGAIVRRAPTRRGTWVTHPLVINADP